jgi:hypothetical protein
MNSSVKSILLSEIKKINDAAFIFYKTYAEEKPGFGKPALLSKMLGFCIFPFIAGFCDLLFYS